MNDVIIFSFAIEGIHCICKNTESRQLMNFSLENVVLDGLNYKSYLVKEFVQCMNETNRKY